MKMMSALRQVSRKCVAQPLALQKGISASCICCRMQHSGGPLSKLNTFRTVKTPMMAQYDRFNESCTTGGRLLIRLLPLTFQQPHRNAGHSKWANIKHVKQANDMARAKELTKYVTFIKAAVREHGSADPKQNGKLAQVIAQIKEKKLPMATIDRCIQMLQAKKDYHNCIHPIKGPGNCIMLIDLESPNLMKSKQELNTILKKNRAICVEESVLYMFDHKGILMCTEINGTAVSEEQLDDATAHAIEIGASDVDFRSDDPEYGNVIQFITEPSAFLKVKGALESLKYEIAHAELSYIPKNWLNLSDEDTEAANKLYNKLLEHEDVQKVHVNIA